MYRRLFILLFTLSVALPLAAQSTTSSLTGIVTTTDNSPLAGATVVATHTPSATTYGTVTDRSGAYHIDGMRAGGPYTIEISFVGYQSIIFKEISLALGERHITDATLNESQAIDTVIVTANKHTDGQTGAGSYFNNEMIEILPSVSRSIYDITRLSPHAISQQSGGASIAGANSRYNTFQIDGMANNDVFGLTSSGTNGGLTDANPIPLDALDAIQIVVAPFDVRQSGFTGGGINAITKSGTNTFTGTAYAYYNDNNFYGKGPSQRALSKQSSQIYGASIGGAIIKDRLFFFVSGEYNRDLSPSSYYPGYNGCSLSIADVKQIAEQYKALTGWDGGGYGERDIERYTGSLVARLDWNINSRHNLMLRYNMLDAAKDSYSNDAATFSFNGTGYASTASTHSIVGELNSRISERTYNELRVGYTRVKDGRDCDNLLPYVQIKRLRDGDGTTVNIGTDPYAGMNALTQNTITLTDNFTLYTGNHSLTIGTHNEFFAANNLYVANSLGSYTYNSLDDFIADKARKYVRSYPIGEPSIRFSTAQFSLYIQDEWRKNNLTLTYGLRADLPIVFNTPLENKAFNESEIAKRYDLQTNRKPRTNILFSPRIGLRWQAVKTDNYSLLVRGGAGLFTGKIPFVWITNCYSNTGMTQRSYTLDSSKGQTVPAFGQEPSGDEGVSSNPAINIVNPKFRYPQVLRTNIAIEQIYRGWNFTVEGLYSKSFNNPLVYNIVAQRSNQSLLAVDEQHRTANNTTTLYETSLAKQYSSIYYLTNTNRGYSYSISGSIAKTFDFGLRLSAAYTYGRSYSVNDGVSSQASSTWGKTYATESDNQALTCSIFDTPHKITASLSYSKRYARYFGTTVSLVYQAYSGMRYSLTYASSADVNGDGYYGNSTIYIPTSNELAAMHFETEEQRAAFGSFIESEKALRDNRGRYLPRNAMQAPFEHHLDLHIAQDFYFGEQTGRKVQLTLDVTNLGNLLCKDWGAYYYINNWRLSPLEVYDTEITANGDKVAKYRYIGSKVSKNNLLSRWHMQIGVRVTF